MKLIGRIVIIILLVLTVLISGFALLCSLGIIEETHINLISETFYNSLSTRAIVGIACAFIILITVLIALLRPKSKLNLSSKVLTAHDGSIKISHQAIIDLIKSLAKEDASVARVRVKPKETDDGLHVLVVLTLRRDSNIKEVTQKVKKDTEEFLVEQCGIKLEEVEVLLDRVIGKI